MKSLLFLGTGAVLHATGERSLGHLGGLIHRMPWVAWTDAGRRARHRRTAAIERLRVGVAAAAVISVRAHGAAPVHQHAAAAGRGADCARRRARRLRHGQILRRHLSRAAARPLDQQGPRRGICGARRTRLACARLRAARLVSKSLHRHVHRGHPAAWIGNIADERCAVVAAAADSRAPVLVRAAGVLRGDPDRGAVRHLRRASLLSPAHTPGRGLGLRLRRPQQPHARHRRRVRSAHSPSVSAVLRHRQRELPSPFDRAPAYRLEIGDRIWLGLYLPVGALVRLVADRVAWLQQGRIATYLLYSFATLVVLLALAL